MIDYAPHGKRRDFPGARVCAAGGLKPNAVFHAGRGSAGLRAAAK